MLNPSPLNVVLGRGLGLPPHAAGDRRSSSGETPVRDVTHVFPGCVTALSNVSLHVPRGQFVCLVGPSGCGKSTQLMILAGLHSPTAGDASVDSAPAAAHRAAYMPQRDLLLPWRRTLANATLGAEIAGVSRQHARVRARALLPLFAPAGFERAWPSELGGGMRQRLALLRTFLLPRDVLLLDEPFGALDAITRRSMQEWLQDVWLADQRTVLLVTHDVEEALLLADTVYLMTPGSPAIRRCDRRLICRAGSRSVP